MTISVIQPFAPVQLTNSASTIYTVPSNPTQIIFLRGRVRFTNEDTSARAVTAYAIQSGGSASSTNAFMNAESIGPNQHLDVDVPILAAGGFIQALADVTLKVSVFAIDGVLFT